MDTVLFITGALQIVTVKTECVNTGGGWVLWATVNQLSAHTVMCASLKDTTQLAGRGICPYSTGIAEDKRIENLRSALLAYQGQPGYMGTCQQTDSLFLYHQFPQCKNNFIGTPQPACAWQPYRTLGPVLGSGQSFLSCEY